MAVTSASSKAASARAENTSDFAKRLVGHQRTAQRGLPHRGTQLRLHVQHLFTRRDELLGQQVTQPARALDRYRSAHPIARDCSPAPPGQSH
ncbi:MAG: hypothetical protein ABSB01_26695 [Streptosporangiaceae bacterium]